MRRLLVLFLAVFIPVLAARAQENVVTYAPPAAAAAAPQNSGGGEYPQWQVAVGYQFNRIQLHAATPTSASGFHTNGYNISAVRYFGDWFGFETQIGFGFGNTGTSTIPNKLTAKSLFVGGGVHLAFRNRSRWEPWAHGDIGLLHFRFTQTGGKAPIGSNSTLGWLAGGGLDYHVNDRFAIRGEGDYLGSHLFNANHVGYQFGGGIVLNF